MRRFLATLAGSLLVVASMSAGATRAVATDRPIGEAMVQRMARLEAETDALRAELEHLRQQPVRLPQVGADSAGRNADDSTLEVTPASMHGRAPVADADYFTWGELKAEMKRLTFTKGNFRIVPYGYFWADMLYQTHRTTPGPYTVYVPSEEVEGENAFIIDARRSRFGIDVAGPRIPFFDCAVSSAKLEIDFQSPVTSATENRPTVLLRHAYWQAKNERYMVLVGQTWDVFSPLYPGMLNYSVGWDGGNIGYRRAQFRVERYMDFSDYSLLTAQFALAQDIVPDFSTTSGVDREPAGWPVVEGRLGWTLGDRRHGRPVELGVSGHIGETGFDFTTAGPPPLNLPPEDDARFQTWSFNIDLKAPITERLMVKAELFTGANLSPFLGGIGQGVCPCLRVPIRSSGGWFDVGYDLTSRLHLHGGAGLDDPNDNDLLVGRSYNHFIFGNVSFDVTDQLLTGFEVAWWKTLYMDSRQGQIPDADVGPTEPGESVVLEWMVRYGF